MDALKSAISQVGASALRGLTSINPTLGGKAGKAVDVVGKALNNPFPEAYASEQAESAGGHTQRIAIEQDTSLTPQQKQNKINQLNIQTQNRTGTVPSVDSNQGNYNVSREITPNELASKTGMSADDMWNGQEITIDGQKYRVKDTGRGTRTLEPLSSGGGGGSRSLTQDDINNAIAKTPGANEFVNQADLDAIMNRWKEGALNSTDDIARAIEETARRNAEAEYNAIKQALGVQKEETGRLSEEQRGRVEEMKRFGLLDLEDKRAGEEADIEKQATRFGEEVTAQKEILAQNWRDMSLEVQRIMRSRGVTDSSYSAGKETDILMDFNKGLRALATTSTRALKDFSDAIIETNRFYNREKEKLESNAKAEIQKINAWERGQIQSIQAQENMAVAQQFNAIRSAVLEANKLRSQVAQKIADQEMALGVWLVQTETQFKQAVALAGQQKTASAQQGIKDTWDMVKFANDVLEKGGGQIIIDPNTGKPAIHGNIFNPSTNEFEDFLYPITEGGAQTYQTNQAYKQAQAQNAGFLNPTNFTSAQQPQQQQSGGLLGAIGSWINPFD